MKRLVILINAFFACLVLFAQSSQWKVLEQGNQAYSGGRYAEAEKHYLQLLQLQPDYAIAHYNLGLAYMGQQNTEAALKAFEDAIRLTTDENLKARAWHNIGVIREGQALVDAAERTNLLQKAADAYKESLRANPHDDETRYNLALCQHQLRSEQNQQQDQQDQQQDNTQRQQDSPEPQQDPTEQLMNLAQRAEDDTRQKINEARSQQRSLDKNW